MTRERRFVALGLLAAAWCAGAGEPFWWERGAATWYYKDDWKGLSLQGGGAFLRELAVPGGAASGWIVVWGDRGYRLLVNGREVSSSVDGGLIDDVDLSGCLKEAPDRVTLRIEGSRICAEGELVGRDGNRIPFATGDDWMTDRATAPRTRRMEVGPSTGAFHRAHNGRLLEYNDEERGKSAIARGLARIQRLRDQTWFRLRRPRSAEEILFFTRAPYPRAPYGEEQLAEDARRCLESEAVPAQKRGDHAAGDRRSKFPASRLCSSGRADCGGLFGPA